MLDSIRGVKSSWISAVGGSRCSQSPGSFLVVQRQSGASKSQGRRSRQSQIQGFGSFLMVLWRHRASR